MPLTNEERERITRDRDIFRNWAIQLQKRSDDANAIGFGITDSWSDRLATELRTAVDDLTDILGDGPGVPDPNR